MSDKKPVSRSNGISGKERPTHYAAAAPTHEDIARLAYALWETRGGKDDGLAEQDWLEAERQLRQQESQAQVA